MTHYVKLDEAHSPILIHVDLFLGNKDEKERSKHDKKAEEKAAKQEKKREKIESKKKKDIDHQTHMVTNDNITTGTSNKVHEEDYDPNEDYINDRELSSGIQMIALRTSEAIGKIFKFQSYDFISYGINS